jgi:hypothetical protein
MSRCSILFTLTLGGTSMGCQAPAPEAQVVLEAPIFVTAAGDTVLLREELRIGQLDGPDAYTFAMIIWSLQTADGGVILYDLEGDNGDNGRIRQFDATGRFVRYIGGPGEGPGEYSSFPMGTTLADGSLLIADQRLARITRYDTAGRVMMELAGPGLMVEPIGGTDGGWYAGVVAGHPPDKPRRVEYVKYDSLGTLVARFPAPDFYHDGPSGGSGAVDYPTSVVAILPDGRMVSARNDSLMLVVSGGVEGEVRVAAPHRPVAYLAEESDARAAMFRAAGRRAGGDGSAVQIPEFKKVFSYVITDQAGRILVRLRTQGYKVEPDVPLRPNQTPWREPFEVEVFDSTLAHRGRLIAPRSATWRGASFAEGAVWLVHEGEAGELYLVKWRSPGRVW